MSPFDGGLFIAAAAGAVAIAGGIAAVGHISKLPQAPRQTTTRMTEVRDAAGETVRTTITTTEKD